jgi:hypothetical protein
MVETLDGENSVDDEKMGDNEKVKAMRPISEQRNHTIAVVKRKYSEAMKNCIESYRSPIEITMEEDMARDIFAHVMNTQTAGARMSSQGY